MIGSFPRPSDRYDRANESAFRRSLEQYLGQLVSEVNANAAFYSKAESDARFAPIAHTHTFASITAKPTTIAGYGITDLNALGDARWLSLTGGTVHSTTGGSDLTLGAAASLVTQLALGTSSAIGALGTTYSGAWTALTFNASQTAKATDNWHQSAALISSGIFLKNTGIDFNFAASGSADAARATFWGTPVATLSSAGAFNAIGTISQNGVAVSLNGHTHTFASLTSKPTTIAGYGITDFNSLGDARWGQKAVANIWTGANTFSAAVQFNTLLKGGIGALTTAGVLDWNDITNARSGQGDTLLLGSAANGPGPANYFHPFSFEYSSKGGTGNLTQFAVPYGLTPDVMYMRGRFSGNWSAWVTFITSSNFNSLGDARWGLTAAVNTWSAKNTFAASTAARATVNIATGVDPTTPSDGDIWMTSAGLFIRNNGVTEQLTGSILLE